MTAKEMIACALDESGFGSAEDGFLDSLKSGMNKLMGGIGDKGGAGGGNNMSIAEHDKKEHPQGFNPETDTCSWRDEQIKKGGDPAIYKAPTGQFAAKGGGGGADPAKPKTDAGKGDSGNTTTITTASGEQLTIADGVMKVPSLGMEVKVDQENVHTMAELVDELKKVMENPASTDEQKATYQSILEHLQQNLNAGDIPDKPVEPPAIPEGEETSGTEGGETTEGGTEEIPKHIDPKDWAKMTPTEEMIDNLQMYDKNGDLVQFESQEEFDNFMMQRAEELRGAVTQYDAVIKSINESFSKIDDMLEAFAKKNGIEYERQFSSFSDAILDAELDFTEAEGVDILDSEQAKDEWKKYKEAFAARDFDKARKHREKFEKIRDKVLGEQKQAELDKKFTIDENRDIGDGKPLDEKLLNPPRDITPDPESVMETGDKIEEVMTTDKFAKGLLDAQKLEEIKSGPTVSKYVFSVGENHNFSKFAGEGKILTDNNILAAINGALGLNPQDEKNPRGAIVRLEGDKVVVEVPNQERKTVGLANLLQNEGFRQKFEERKKEGKATCPISICADNGDVVLTWDMDDDPHIGFAGTTGAGKSVAFKSAIRSLMALYGPDEIGFLLADPKMVEFSEFNGSKHLECPVATDPEEIRSMVKNLMAESKKRSKILEQAQCQNIAEYNAKFPDKKMKRLVLGIDELSLLVTKLGEDFRDGDLATLMNVCRSQGIHVMWGTQTPSKQTLGAQLVNATGARVGLKCKDIHQSQQILGQGHTEAADVMKKGDGYFTSEHSGTWVRMQAPFSPKEEQERINQSEKGEDVEMPSEGGGEGEGSGEGSSGGAEGGDAEFAKKQEAARQASSEIAKKAIEAKGGKFANPFEKAVLEGMAKGMGFVTLTKETFEKDKEGAEAVVSEFLKNNPGFQYMKDEEGNHFIMPDGQFDVLPKTGGSSGGSTGSGSAGGGEGGEGGKAGGGAAPKKPETLAERTARKAKEAEEAKAKAEAEAQEKYARFSTMKPEERMAEYDKEMNSEIGKAIAAEQARRGGAALSMADMAMIAKPIQDKYSMLKQNEMAQTDASAPKMTANEMAYKTAEAEYSKNPTLDNRRKAVEAEKKAAMERASTASEQYQIEKKYNNVLKQIDADIAEETNAKNEEAAQKQAAKDKEAEKTMETYKPMIEAYNATKTEEGNTDEANMAYLDALKKHQLAMLDAKNLPPEQDAEQRKAIRAEYDKNAAPFKKNIEAKQVAAEKEKAQKEKEEEAKKVQAEREKAAQEKEAAHKAKEEEKAKVQAEKEKAQKAKADEEAKVKAEAEKKEKRKTDARTAYEKEPTAANKQSIVEIDAEEAVERAKSKKYKTEAERAEAIKKVQEEEAEKVEVAKMDTATESLQKTMEGMKDLIESSKTKEGREKMSQVEKEEVGRVRRQFADNEAKKGKYQIEKMRKEGKHKDGSPYTEKDYKRDMARLTRWSNWAHNTAEENAPFKRMFDPYTFDHVPTAKEIMQEALDEAEYGVVEDADLWLKDDVPTAKDAIAEALKSCES